LDWRAVKFFGMLNFVDPYFTARRRFDSVSEGWEKYLEFSKIPQLIEVVGLDCTLCPQVLEEFDEEDLEFLSEHYEYGTFSDLDHLLARLDRTEKCNVLAVIRDPIEHLDRLMEPGFNFAGYELLEEQTSISALTNCGGFPKAFSNDELNEVGLVANFARAREVQRALAKNYPNEPHAQTTLYALWRLDEYAGVPVDRG
jgi:hypothetical protein